jgi:uncharacterized protein YaeQ
MALSATMYVFTIRLADADRNVYETLSLRVAQHPSETVEYMLTRVLAYCLEYTEGLAFSRGVSDVDEPALSIRDLTGALRAWIEVGTPEAARLHKASKAAPRVAVYVHRDADAWLARLQGERIHRAGEIAIHVMDPALIAGLARRLQRRMDWDLSIAERTLYLTLDDETLSGAVEARSLLA